MVDLRESFQPAGSANPLPISEIAARAGRRRRRRLATVTAAALLAIAGTGALVINSLPRSDTAVVADAAEPTPSTTDRPGPTGEADTTTTTTTTTEPAATEDDTGTTSDATPSADADPEPSETDETGTTPAETDAGDPNAEDAEPSTTPGLRTETTTTSRWEDGYCVEIEVNNEGETTARTWQVVLDLDGTIATLWSATVDDSTDGRFVFSGVAGYNATLDAGTLTTFGACLDLEAG